MSLYQRRRYASPVRPVRERAEDRGRPLALIETCSGQIFRYHIDGASSTLTLERSAANRQSPWAVANELLSAAFLPVGYPRSVRSEYLRFQVYDTLQAACSYLRSILATSAILKASGVGEGTASPMAAAVAWVLRDGFGMCGSLIFASLVGSGFDENVKEWRLFADLINDVGLTLNMMAALVGPKYYILVTALGAMCTSICGMVAGATRASITAHFALEGNLADVSAKEGAQETAVTMVGLLIGSYLFAPIIGDSPSLVWIAFGTLTLLHVYANWRGVGCLVLPWLNLQRASILVVHWVSSKGTALTPDAVASKERIWGPVLLMLFGPKLNCRLPELCNKHADVELLRDIYVHERYWLRVDSAGRPRIIFARDADGQDTMKALLQCALLDEAKRTVLRVLSDRDPPEEPTEVSILKASYNEMRRQWPDLVTAMLREGWEQAGLRAAPRGWRYEVSSSSYE